VRVPDFLPEPEEGDPGAIGRHGLPAIVLAFELEKPPRLIGTNVEEPEMLSRLLHYVETAHPAWADVLRRAYELAAERYHHGGCEPA
jgi:hypothetical protein